MVKQQEEIKEENHAIEKGIDELTQDKNNTQVSHDKIVSKMDSINSVDSQAQYPDSIKEKLTELKSDLEKTKNKLESYREKNKDLKNQIKESTTKIGKHKLKIKNLEFERESILKWIEDNPGKPIVNANGIIMAKTVIQAINSRRILEEELKNVLLKEMRDTSPGAGLNAYKIDIAN